MGKLIIILIFRISVLTFITFRKAASGVFPCSFFRHLLLIKFDFMYFPLKVSVFIKNHNFQPPLLNFFI